MPAPKRRLTAFAVAMAVLIATPLAVMASDRFIDVPDNNVHHADITWLADAGVTLGCNPPANNEFCPEDPVLRQQMASFLRRLAENQVVDAATAVTAETAEDANTLDGKDSSFFLPAEVPPGETVRGTVGFQLDAEAGVETGANAQLPIPAPVGLTDDTVTVDGGADETTEICTGSPEDPSAPPGHVCIYPYTTENAVELRGYIWADGDGTRWGFQLSWVADTLGATWVFGNWAYTAPMPGSPTEPVGGADPVGVGGTK